MFSIMIIDILALILFSFYKSYVKQTIKYYNLISGRMPDQKALPVHL